MQFSASFSNSHFLMSKYFPLTFGFQTYSEKISSKTLWNFVLIIPYAFFRRWIFLFYLWIL
jgi:hypothetical protein